MELYWIVENGKIELFANDRVEWGRRSRSFFCSCSSPSTAHVLRFVLLEQTTHIRFQQRIPGAHPMSLVRA